jgi:hypothetical protein
MFDPEAGNTKRGRYHCTIDLQFDWFGLVCFANIKNVSCHTADSKPVKQEVNGTVILPPLEFPAHGHLYMFRPCKWQCYGKFLVLLMLWYNMCIDS